MFGYHAKFTVTLHIFFFIKFTSVLILFGLRFCVIVLLVLLACGLWRACDYAFRCFTFVVGSRVEVRCIDDFGTCFESDFGSDASF